MPLVRLQDGQADWGDIKNAADILWKTSTIADMNTLRSELRNHYNDPTLDIVDLHTGRNARRKGTVTWYKETILIAFDGAAPDELYMNFWTHGKGPEWWQLPYTVHVNGHRVHSFYLDM